MTDEHLDLSIEIDTDGEVATVEVRGEVDIAVAQELEEALAPSRLGGREAVVVDLSEVGFMDSSGVRALLLGRSRLQEAGISLAVVVGSDSPVKRVLDLVEVGDLLPMFPERAEAVSALEDGDE